MLYYTNKNFEIRYLASRWIPQGWLYTTSINGNNTHDERIMKVLVFQILKTIPLKTVYVDMHFKDFLGSIARVRYRIPIPDFNCFMAFEAEKAL